MLVGVNNGEVLISLQSNVISDSPVLLQLMRGSSHEQASTLPYTSPPTTAVLSIKLMDIYVDKIKKNYMHDNLWHMLIPGHDLKYQGI